MARLAFCAEVAPLGVNRAYAPAKWGDRIGFRKTPEAEAYAAALKAACPLRSMLDGPVKVTIAFYWPTEAGDIDGPIKLTLDAVQGSAYANDRQVKELHVLRLTDRARPRVVVEVEELAIRVPSQPAAEKPQRAGSARRRGFVKSAVSSVRSFRPGPVAEVVEDAVGLGVDEDVP